MEEMVQVIFIILVGWFASEWLDGIANDWRNTPEQLKTRLDLLEERLEQRLDDLQSQWGTPIPGDRAVEEIKAAISRLKGLYVLRMTHAVNQPATSRLHEVLQSYIASVKERQWDHHHLWRVACEIDWQHLNSYVHECGSDRSCRIECLGPDVNMLNLELILFIEREVVGRRDVFVEREAFVIMPVEDLPGGGYVAYHLSGSDTVRPLNRLWSKWCNKATPIKDDKGVNEKNLRDLYERVCPSPPPQTQAPVEALIEEKFWDNLVHTLGSLPPGSAVDEMRIGSATCLSAYERCDEAIKAAYTGGNLQKYRRVHMIAVNNEITKVREFVKGCDVRDVQIFGGLDQRNKQSPKPWSFWIIKSGTDTVLYLRRPDDIRPWPPCGFLVIREPSVVSAFREYFNEWWSNKPQRPEQDPLYGLVRDDGDVLLGNLERELAGR